MGAETRCWWTEFIPSLYNREGAKCATGRWYFPARSSAPLCPGEIRRTKPEAGSVRVETQQPSQEALVRRSLLGFRKHGDGPVRRKQSDGKADYPLRDAGGTWLAGLGSED